MSRAAGRALAAVALLCPAAALALTPLPPCEGVVESNMMVSGVSPLGGYGAASGLVVESYRYDLIEGPAGTLEERVAPVPQLQGVNGTRVTDCSTGEFLVIDGPRSEQSGIALAATEFLRSSLQAGERVRFADARRAAEALYGPVLILRETEQTCGCSAFFPDLRPGSQTPFDQRADRQGAAP